MKALLGAAQPASPPAPIPAPPSAPSVPAAASPSAPVPVAANGVKAPVPTPVAVATPVIPTTPPVPESPLVKNTLKRGWLMARIEEIIAEGGPTFSYHTVFEAYKSKWGWRRWPTESSIGATVWKVVRKRGHPVLHPGSGRRSTVYQKEIRT